MENQQELITDELVMDEATVAIEEPQAEMAPDMVMEEPTQEPQAEISELDIFINKISRCIYTDKRIYSVEPDVCNP